MLRSTLRQTALALPLTALALAASTASAATVGPSDASFYNVPATIPAGSHGDLISYRKINLNLGAGAPGVNAWTVMYQSTDSLGVPNVVTGTVIVPSALWLSLTPRPVMSYAVGTHGLAQKCAPSMQLAAGTDYENANIVAALKAGHAVLVTDYQGYTNGSTPTYLAGASQGHAVLDIFKAASQIPSSGVSASAKSMIWGFSQGGQSAAWAGELKSTYMPSLNLVGVAAGGIPADFKATATVLNGSAGASFLLGGVIGLAQQYPNDIPLSTLANANGQAAIARGKSECVFEALFDFFNHNISEYTVGNQTLDQLEAIPSVSKTLDAQNLGTTKIPVPLYQYHGQADEFVPLDQDIALKKKYCSKFADVTFALYPSEHIATQFQAAPYVISWFADRLNGKATSSNCLNLAPQPKSTANPGGGNLVVSLKDWNLGGTVTVAALSQTLTLPSGSTFSGDTDLTSPRLTGNLVIPEFTARVNILGFVPTDVKLKITQTQPAAGTASLDNNGQLHVHGKAYANISITSANAIGINIPAGCTTSAPVVFPLDFDGPVSALGSGNLVFSGTTTFPALSGCGSNAGLLNLFFSGSGQKFTFTVTAPAPVNW